MSFNAYYRLMAGACILSLTASIQSCVDHDYDLGKDVDLTIGVGGDLSLPSSSTENYTVAQILDLSSSSSIKPIGHEYGLGNGDYVLVQSDSTDTHVEINTQDLGNIQCNPTQVSLSVPLNMGSISIDSPTIPIALNISENNIDPTILSIIGAETDIKFDFAANFTSSAFNGTMTIQPGYSLTFPEAWIIKITDPSTLNFCKVQGSKVVFTSAKTLNASQTLHLPIIISGIDCTKMPSGQSLYAPGHFRMDDNIVCSGPLQFNTSSASSTGVAAVSLNFTPNIAGARLISITGRVNPVVNIASTTFSIYDIPEFLREPGNNLDLANPQFLLKIKNGAPIDVDVNFRAVATDANGSQKEVWIGSKYGTAPIFIAASRTSEICISRQGNATMPSSANVIVPALGTLLETIPVSIAIDHIEANVPSDQEYTFNLGSTFDVKINYTAVVPLAFGPDLHITYHTDTKGWDADLNKYNFKEAIATLTATSSVPLEMSPTVQALDHQGYVMNDVTCTVEGTLSPGTVAAPSTSQLKVTIKCNAANIGRLDGLQFSFDVTSTPTAAGIPLNYKQSIRFTNISLKLKGGVTVDLN